MRTSTRVCPNFAGDGETVTVGQPLSLIAALTDATGLPVPGVSVTFRLTEGLGTLNPAVVTTDEAGLAVSIVEVRAAGTNVIEASVEGGQTTFTVTGQADPNAPNLVPVSGNIQTIDPGQALPEPLVVRLEDQFGNPLAGQLVTATILQGVATFLSPAEILTDANGQASFEVQAGEGDIDIVVQIQSLGRTVQFLAIVGSADTPDFPFDIALNNGFIYIADRFEGIQFIGTIERQECDAAFSIVENRWL